VSVTLLIEILDYKSNFMSACWMHISRDNRMTDIARKGKTSISSVNCGSWLVVIDSEHTGNNNQFSSA